LWRIFTILLLKKSPKQHGQGNFFENFSKKKNPPYFKEESCEMAKIFGAFGHISSFLSFEIAIFS